MKRSIVLGTPVTAGYFRAPSGSGVPEDLVLFAHFQIDGIYYYLRQSGDSTLEDAMRQEFSELIGLLISGGAPDLSILSRPKEKRKVAELSIEADEDHIKVKGRKGVQTRLIYVLEGVVEHPRRSEVL